MLSLKGLFLQDAFTLDANFHLQNSNHIDKLVLSNLCQVPSVGDSICVLMWNN